MSASSASAAVASPAFGGVRPTLPFDFGNLGPGWREIVSNGWNCAVFGRPIEQSLNDTRNYRLITLSNGLEALLVSDPETDKAAVSLSVEVGHLSDPDDLPGLAHFCEHLLFLGTSKYPDEAAYKLYLSQHSGSSNAFTSLDETNYHLEVSPAGLPGALSRHSQFFTSPLFLPSCTERELKAVDSEFRRNLQLDSRRLFQLGKATSNRVDGAVYWKFGTGSKETLEGTHVRERLLEWYAEQYSANLMHLVVLSSQSLDELQRLVLAEYSAIPNSNRDSPVFDTPPLTREQLNTEISYRQVKDTPQLRLEFPFPETRTWWKTKPGRYISHLIGHEGAGSILADLKQRGWANSLSSSSGSGAAGFEFFRIDVSMTALGLANYKHVLAIIFAYIDILKSTPPQEWIFNETKTLGEMSFRWKENAQPGSTVKNLASQLSSLYPREKLLAGPWFATEFDAALIQRCVDGLTPEQCRVFVGSTKPLPGRAEWELQEKYYSTEYSFGPLTVVALDATQAPLKLHLPSPNPFIPSRLELVARSPLTNPLKRPSLVRQTPTSRLFYMKDDRWHVPRAAAYFMLKSPLADASPVAALKAQIFTNLVEEALAEYSYDAVLAGLSYSVGNDPKGIEVIVRGYNDKLSVLLDVVVGKMKNLVVDPSTFTMVHDRLCRAYANANLSNPSTIGDTHLRHLTRQTHWTYDQRLEALRDIKPVDIQDFVRPLLEQLEIEALVHGNITKDDACALVKLVESHLAPKQADPEANDYHRGLLLPTGCNLVYRPSVPSPENVNSSLSTYYQVGPKSDHALYCRLQLFSQLSKVPIFSTLRTQEQLGYIVSSGVWASNGMAGFRVVVQSEKIGEYLEDRVEAMWAAFGTNLEEMEAEDFEKQRQSVVSKLLEKPKNLGQETERYWDEIDSGEFDFFHRERDAALIGQITQQEITAFFTSFIRPSSTRTKLSILMRSQRYQPEALEPLLTAFADLSPDALASVTSLVQSKPTLLDLTAFVDAHAPGQERVREALQALQQLPELREGVQEIDSVEAFRSRLNRSDAVVVVDDFVSDLAPHL